MTTQPSPEELLAALDDVAASPADGGTLDMIVRRPAEGAREVLDHGELSLEVGLVGDNWIDRGSTRTDDGASHPDMQLNVMNARFLAAIAGSRERMALAGDQLIVDLDLRPENVPPGTQLAIGDAVIEVTAEPHRGCAKFTERFGIEAFRFVNGEVGMPFRLRGINARVVTPGAIRAGDAIKKL